MCSGGAHMNGSATTDIIKYDDDTDEWMVAGQMNMERHKHAVSTLTPEQMKSLWKLCV